MNIIGKLVILFFVALAAPAALAEDGSNNALSGVRPAGPPPHIQKEDASSKTKQQIDKNLNKLKRERIKRKNKKLND